MDFVVLALSLLILAGCYWFHRWQLRRAYAAGWAAALDEQDQRERHGLAALPTHEE